MTAVALQPDLDEHRKEDHYIVLDGASWADYQRVLEVRGDHSAPRIVYLEGRLQILSPSNRHEEIKSLIGCLVDVWCEEKGIDFWKRGSWTLEDKTKDRGIEPDECYVFGPRGATRPDLAIEVVWTSGGINKLEIYRQLGVREVWIWRREELTPYVLRGEYYEAATESAVLPGIDVRQIGSLLDQSTGAATRAYREMVRKA